MVWSHPMSTSIFTRCLSSFPRRKCFWLWVFKATSLQVREYNSLAATSVWGWFWWVGLSSVGLLPPYDSSLLS